MLLETIDVLNCVDGGVDLRTAVSLHKDRELHNISASCKKVTIDADFEELNKQFSGSTIMGIRINHIFDDLDTTGEYEILLEIETTAGICFIPFLANEKFTIGFLTL